MNETYYKISEKDLLSLLRSRVELTLLHWGGVDNWSWYGEGWDTFLREWAKELNPEEDFEDEEYIEQDWIAEMLLNTYEKL